LKRLHGAYVSDNEIDQLVLHIKNQRAVQYLDFQAEVEQLEGDEDRDDIYEDVLEYLEEIDEISISLLQRKFRIGYNRSARIIDMLEAEGLISSSGNGKTRSVIR
jgi:S-DNA-T family DNA segregation ATPase FtsK/SpoIIIE